MDLSEFKKNIISWYPIKNNQTVLEIENCEEIIEYLNEKTIGVSSFEVKDILNGKTTGETYDYVVLIGIFEKLNNIDEITKVLNFSKNVLKENGKILLGVQNKFGMKYWAGESLNENEKPYISLTSQKENCLGIVQIKNILRKLDMKYKFYYPLPDYKFTNVIFTDKFMPDIDSIDSRDITFGNSKDIINFSEREVYKQILCENKDIFPFFCNSYFVEISNATDFADVNFVSFGITRKKEYRIKTIIKTDKVYKFSNDKNSEKHIKDIAHNIEILRERDIEVLGDLKDGCIETKYLKNAESLDNFVGKIYEEYGIKKLVEFIKNYKINILDKLVEEISGKDVFENYDVNIPVKFKNEMHFAENGMIDLIFQNCLVENDKVYVYDQEWYEKNVPIEFILYRAILYSAELKKIGKTNEILQMLNLEKYVKYFEILENRIQEKLLDKNVWENHVDYVRKIGNTREILNDYKSQLKAANEHIENLEKVVSEHETGIKDLTKLVQDKDVELVNYANQLRTISQSFSWKITKPIRIFSWVFNPKSGASFIDRIMPPGGKRRLKYDKKQTEKKYKKKVENYFKLTDSETAEYWKGIDHRKYLKYEKDLKRKQEDTEYKDYDKWIEVNTPTDQEIEKQEHKVFRKRPKISIVIPLYNTDTDFFRELLYTIHCQTYKKWELCLADGSEKELTEIKKMCEKDKRIKYKFLGENKGIAGNTNAAIELATGDYVALLDHDDMLDISALYEVVKIINENPNADFIYTDEDKFHFIDEPRFEPHFKPDFAPDTLRANNYICHFSVIKKKLLDEIGGFRQNFDGAQDFDIILRITEKANKIVHIPKILYHWRIHKGSTSMTSEAKPYAILAGKRAVEEHLKRVGLKGIVYEGAHSGTYKIEYDVIGTPKITILIPNKDEKETLKDCIDSIIQKTTYKNYEIVIIENNSKTDEIFEYYNELIKNEKIKILNYNKNTILDYSGEKKLKFNSENPEKFNYSKIINFGVKNTSGEFVVQLNNDTEIITPNWLEQMVGFCQREDVGAVRSKIILSRWFNTTCRNYGWSRYSCYSYV